MKSKAFTYLATVLAALGSAHAGVSIPLAARQPVATTGGGWDVTFGLYAWTAGLDGDIGAGGRVVPVDLSFSDILDTLDMTAMGMVEIGRGRWWFQFEGMYLKNSDGGSAAMRTGATAAAKVVSETTRLEPVFGYRVFGNESTGFDLLAGAVYYDISNEIVLHLPRRSIAAESRRDWLDPIVGMRVRHRFAERWSLLARGDIGGFGVSADLAWQLNALVGYDINGRATAYAGYRHAAVDYRSGGFAYDAAASGPILGLGIAF